MEWGFGSCAMLIIKTCETFVSSLALPFWMAARGLAWLQHLAVRAAPGAAVLDMQVRATRALLLRPVQQPGMRLTSPFVAIIHQAAESRASCFLLKHHRRLGQMGDLCPSFEGAHQEPEALQTPRRVLV